MPARLSRRARARVEALRADRAHGASWLARAALRAVAASARESRARTLAGAHAQVRALADALAATRPGMTAPRVWLTRLAAEADRLAAEPPPPALFLERVAARADALAAAARRAEEAAAAAAAGLIAANDVVFTASASGTVVEACRRAARAGRLAAVLAAESRSDDGASHGEAVARALGESGVRVEVVPDAEIARRAGEATRALLGADTLYPDGSVLNGRPSLALARAARAAGRPVLVACESAKLDRWSSSPGGAPPRGFDLVPAELVSLYVTEYGPRRAAELPALAAAAQ